MFTERSVASLLYAAIAGIFSGLIMLRISDLNIILWLASFLVLAINLNKNSTLTIFQFFIYSFFKNLVGYSWILETILKKGQLSIFSSLSLYLFTSIVISLPIIIFYFSSFLLFIAKTKIEDFRFSFLALYPGICYFSDLILEYWPLGGIPLGGISETNTSLFYLKSFYPIIGVQGVSFLFNLILINFILFFIHIYLERVKHKKEFYQIKTKSLAVYFNIFLLILTLFFLLIIPQDISKNKGDYLKIKLQNPDFSKFNEQSPNKQKEFLDNLFARKNKEQSFSLLIWPESALPGVGEQGRLMEEINKRLNSNQSILFGTDRKEFSTIGFNYFNSALLLSGNDFDYSIYRKNKLVPFAEYLPNWAKTLNLPPVIKRNYLYTSGINKQKILKLKQNHKKVNLGIGICFEQLFDSWYESREKSDAGIYIFLNREILFSKFAQNIIFQAAKAKALQTYRPIIRVADAGKSGLLGWQSKMENKTLNKELLLEIKLVKIKSFYFQYKKLISLLIILSQLFLLIVLKYDLKLKAKK